MFIHINKLTLQTTSVRRHDVVIAITSANVFIHPIGVNSIGNFRRLLFNGHQNVARFVVETCLSFIQLNVGHSNVTNRLPLDESS